MIEVPSQLFESALKLAQRIAIRAVVARSEQPAIGGVEIVADLVDQHLQNALSYISSSIGNAMF